MTTGGGEIAAEIDLRANWKGVREQGDRPTCLACATSDAHAALQQCDPLSAEFLFYYGYKQATGDPLSDGLTFDEIAFALKNNGQPIETEWPYQADHPNPWSPPAVTDLWHSELHHAKGDPAIKISDHVRGGRPVVLGISLSAVFLAPLAPNFVIDPQGPGYGGHAVLVVGLGKAGTGETYFLIRNSWGDGWGNGGHAWLSTEYVLDKLIGYAAVSDK